MQAQRLASIRGCSMPSGRKAPGSCPAGSSAAKGT